MVVWQWQYKKKINRSLYSLLLLTHLKFLAMDFFFCIHVNLEYLDMWNSHRFFSPPRVIGCHMNSNPNSLIFFSFLSLSLCTCTQCSKQLMEPTENTGIWMPKINVFGIFFCSGPEGTCGLQKIQKALWLYFFLFLEYCELSIWLTWWSHYRQTLCSTTF